MEMKVDGDLIQKMGKWVDGVESVLQLSQDLRRDMQLVFEPNLDRIRLYGLKILPTIEIKSDQVYCNGVLIPLARRRLAFCLFRIFLDNKEVMFSREQLVDAVYAALPRENRTQRLALALNQNIIKLISRTRMIADAAVNTHDNKWIEWFCYNSETRLWTFFRLTNSYLNYKQSMLGSMLLMESEGKVKINA
jgi:hypothetical protein